DFATLAHGPEGELLAAAAGQPALRRQGGDPSEDGLVRRFELHEQELAVHGDALELVAVRQSQVGVELQAALTETAEDADDLVAREEGQGVVGSHGRVTPGQSPEP